MSPLRSPPSNFAEDSEEMGESLPSDISTLCRARLPADNHIKGLIPPTNHDAVDLSQQADSLVSDLVVSCVRRHRNLLYSLFCNSQYIYRIAGYPNFVYS